MVNHVPTTFVLHTGAAVTLVRGDIWDRTGLPPDNLVPWTGPNLVRADGTPICLPGVAEMSLVLAGVSSSPHAQLVAISKLV